MRTEEFKVSGNDVMKKIKKLIKEGNIRKITVKDKAGKSIAEFPLTVGVVGTVLLPVLASIGTIIALVAECTISVEKEATPSQPKHIIIPKDDDDDDEEEEGVEVEEEAVFRDSSEDEMVKP